MSQLLDAIAGVLNACEPIPGIVTGGQPAPEHLAALKRAGCAVLIDIREAMEPRPFKTPDAEDRLASVGDAGDGVEELAH